MMDNRLLKAKAKRILEENEEVFKYLMEEELKELSRTNFTGASEFEVLKKVFMIEGIKEGMRRFTQRLSQWASMDI